MNLIKILLTLILLLLIATPKTFSNEKDKDLDLKKSPFSEIIDWREEEQRQKYDTILAKKYKIESHTILYQSDQKTVRDPWYSNEKFKIISDHLGNIKGYILSFENLTIPILFYKQKTDDDKPKLVYTRTDAFEIISDINGKKIKLNSFDTVSLNWSEKLIGGVMGYTTKEVRGIFKEKPQKGYNYCQSTEGILVFLENHFETIKNSWQQYLREDSIRINIDNRSKRYENIRSRIKAEVKQYGGDNWEKIMRDIRKKWPALAE